MICIDMDGTLLNSKHEVSERNKKAIKEAEFPIIDDVHPNSCIKWRVYKRAR